MSKLWTITLEEDPETGDLILPFPPDLLEEAGWNEGDVLEWTDRGDGSWSLEKQKTIPKIENHAVELFPPIMYKFQYQFDWQNLQPLIDSYIAKADKNSELEFGNSQSSIYVDHDPPHTWKEFAPFLEWLKDVIPQLAELNHFQNNNYHITWSWINRHSLSGETGEHCHAMDTFVVVCYLKCQKDSGNIVFVDPLEYHKGSYPVNHIFPKQYKHKELEVRTDDVLIFPGFLKHYTKPNITNDDRYILSINVKCG